MKRKLLTVLLALAALLCLCLGLAGCDIGGKHTHTFTNYVYNEDATCTKDGTETGKCSCGVTDTRVKRGTALDHAFENYVYNNDATCTKDGTETAQCERCTETDTRTKQGTSLGHEELEFHPGTATCTSAGTLDYWLCPRCKTKFSDENGTSEMTVFESYEPLGHSFENYVYNGDATCAEDGTETAQCERCSETDTRTKQGTVLGHEMDYHAGTATCYAAGTLDYWRCSRCEKDFIDEIGTSEMTVYESDQPLGHKYTAENKCVRYEQCGTEWEYTEGLNYTLNSRYGIYIVTKNGTASGDVVIPYGYQGKFVTSIGDGAFDECSGLTSITIPDSVTSIGESAFGGCGGLENVTFGSGVTSIGRNAFFGCSELTSVTIPDSVTSIGENAFYNCSGLTGELKIPDSVTSIGKNAFYGCDGIESITVAENSQDYSSQDAILYNKTKTEIVHIPKAIKGSVTIPDSIASIKSYAFDECVGLTSITIPGSVTSIGHHAFEYCIGLTEVHITDLTAWCRIDFGSNLSNPLYYAHHLYLDGNEVKDLTISNEITEIKNCAFSGFNELTSITIPDHVTSIGDGAFDECSGLTSITIPDSVTSIGELAFSGCSRLESVTIGIGVTSIGELAFYNCSGLESIIWNAENCTKAGTTNATFAIFRECTNLKTVTFGETVKIIPAFAFYCCEGLTGEINIPGSVTSIGDWAFEGCYQITSIKIGNNVATIGDWAFAACKSLTSIVIPDSVTEIGQRAFWVCWELESVTIGNGVVSIGVETFDSCSGLKSVTIGSGVTSIGENAFRSCGGLEKISVASGNEKYHSLGNCIIETETKTLILGCKNSKIPDEVTSIGSYAFQDCLGLTSIEIPDSVTSIEANAFDNCGKLKSIVIHNSVTSIGDEAFHLCDELTDIQFKGTVEEWNTIEKGNLWNSFTGYYTITCTNGKIAKDGTVTMN